MLPLRELNRSHLLLNPHKTCLVPERKENLQAVHSSHNHNLPIQTQSGTRLEETWVESGFRSCPRNVPARIRWGKRIKRGEIPWREDRTTQRRKVSSWEDVRGLSLPYSKEKQNTRERHTALALQHMAFVRHTRRDMDGMCKVWNAMLQWGHRL
jgi:hypothetical protein